MARCARNSTKKKSKQHYISFFSVTARCARDSTKKKSKQHRISFFDEWLAALAIVLKGKVSSIALVFLMSGSLRSQ
jgi:hypothetical protein